MLKGVLSAADVQGIAIGQEWFASLFLDRIGDDLRIIRPQEGKVPRLAEMHLDGDELAVDIKTLDSRRGDELFQFRQSTLFSG
jgi:hypothetical protein